MKSFDDLFTNKKKIKNLLNAVQRFKKFFNIEEKNVNEDEIDNSKESKHSSNSDEIKDQLELDLIDDYFVNVFIGDSKTKFKLLIDPTYPFTYIFKSYKSKTKKNAELKPLLFSNLYGNYSGKWSIDTFYFKEENATIEMKYLDIYYKKENILNVDGVLGLGSYIKQDTNIYYNINQTYQNCFNKISTYDKKNKKIIICDTSLSSKSNNILIDFSYNTFNYPGLITITKLDLLMNNKEIGLNDEVFVGLIPLFISPNNAQKLIEDIYFENVEKSKNITEVQIIIEKLNYKIYFIY